MKSAFNLFRSLPVAHRFVVLAELVAVIALALVLSMGDAKAQAGNVYANPQVQSPGETFAGVVVQVMVKQSEPSGTDRAAGAAVGGSIGALVGSRIGSDNRFAESLANGQRTSCSAARRRISSSSWNHRVVSSRR
jgi:outer membrane lipoprotein SlyB